MNKMNILWAAFRELVEIENTLYIAVDSLSSKMFPLLKMLEKKTLRQQMSYSDFILNG